MFQASDSPPDRLNNPFILLAAILNPDRGLSWPEMGANKETIIKASLLALIAGGLWAPFYAQAADNGQPPAAAGQVMTDTQAAEARAKPAVAIAGRVTRALFTRKVKDLEPVDTVSVLTNDKTRITYFTEIHGMAGQTITHRWEFNGKVVLEKNHEVGSSHWRAYTSKTLDPTWLGEWKASVVDAAGGTLSVNTFTYMRKSGVGATPVSAAPN